jgi:hypothetical protein
MSPEQAKDYGIIDAVYSVSGDSLIAQAHDLGLAGGEGSSAVDAETVAAAGPSGASPAPRPLKDQ